MVKSMHNAKKTSQRSERLCFACLNNLQRIRHTSFIGAWSVPRWQVLIERSWSLTFWPFDGAYLTVCRPYVVGFLLVRTNADISTQCRRLSITIHREPRCEILGYRDDCTFDDSQIDLLWHMSCFASLRSQDPCTCSLAPRTSTFLTTVVLIYVPLTGAICRFHLTYGQVVIRIQASLVQVPFFSDVERSDAL
jgi:hypothetical protein